MDIVDRFVGHDAWTTRQLLNRCAELDPAAMDAEFELGHPSLRLLFNHIIENMEYWTAVMSEKPVVDDSAANAESMETVNLKRRLDRISVEFAEVARKINRENRADQTFAVESGVDRAFRLTFGGAVAHLITHSMHHRAHILFIMKRLGVTPLIEGDVLGWEEAAFGWR
jgi:uncharacterized damage-inducible protein DinB